MARQKEVSCLGSATAAVGSRAVEGNRGQVVSRTVVGGMAQDGGSKAASFGVVQSCPYVRHN
jgi:hypothetical protein